MSFLNNYKFVKKATVLLALLGCAALGHQVWAVDISDAPIATVGGQAKPNVMLLMDTSDSMKFTHMPDEWERLKNFGATENAPNYFPMGYKSSLCNSLYYDPMHLYQLPKNADGTDMPMPDFYAAFDDGYDVASRRVDLSKEFQAYDRRTRVYTANAEDPPQPAYYFNWRPYSASYTVKPSFSIPKLCAYPTPNTTAVPYVTYGAEDDGTRTTTANIWSTNAGGSGADGYWDRKVISSISGIGPAGKDERQNFAIWYSYYRTRMNMAKSAVSRSFAALDKDFRVGFVTVAEPKDGKGYLPLAEFDAGQKNDWFNTLKSQKPAGTSPAREALARVGRHYAGLTDGINASMPWPASGDPVTNYCQKNYSIVTTDGYWNAQDETKGPVKIDGVTLVGQQDGPPDFPVTGPDGLTPRPIFDGSQDGVKWIYDSVNTYSLAKCSDDLGYTLVVPGGGTKTRVKYEKRVKKDIQTTIYSRADYKWFKKNTLQYKETRRQIFDFGTVLKYNTHTEWTALVTNSVKATWSTQSRSFYYFNQRQYVNEINVAWKEQWQGGQQKIVSKTTRFEERYLARPAEQWILTDWCDKTDTNRCQYSSRGPAGPIVVTAAQCTPAMNGTLTSDNYKITCVTEPDTVSPGGGTCSPAFVANVGDVRCEGTGVEHNGPVAQCNVPMPGLSGYVEYGPCVPKNLPVQRVETCPSVIPADWQPSSTNGYRTTTCAPRTLSGPSKNNSCTEGDIYDAGTGVRTECKKYENSERIIPANSCTPNATYNKNTATDRWERCGDLVFYSSGTYTPTQCQGYQASSNGKTQYWVDCTPQPSSTGTAINPALCPAATADSACQPFTGGSSYTDSCENKPADASNGWVATVCTPTTNPGTSLGTCTPDGTSDPNVHGETAVLSCSAGDGAATAANQCVQTSCRVERASQDEPVKTCSTTSGTVGPAFLTTTCDPQSLTVQPVPACPATPPESYMNVTCTTSAPPANQRDMAYGSCKTQAPTKDNDWVEIKCDSKDDVTYLSSSCTSNTSETGVETICKDYPEDPVNILPGEVCKDGWDPATQSMVTCNIASATTTEVAACPNPLPQGATCTRIQGQKLVYRADWTTRKATMTGTVAGTPVVTASGYVVGDVGTPAMCYSPSNLPVLPASDHTSNGRGREKLPATHQQSASCQNLPCEVYSMNTATGGSSNSMADVAQYYYATDLRAHENNPAKWPWRVRPSGTGAEDDKAPWQHMTTYVIGLGVSGTLKYQDDYRTSLTGDFADIRRGTKYWPIWPDPAYNYASNFELYENPRAIDDFWHTAVNGRGQYFSARDPAAIEAGLSQVFTSIKAAIGSGASVAVSSPVTEAGNNFAYAATYQTRLWTGDLVAFTIDLSTGERTQIENWSAQQKLNGRTADTRDIYMMGNKGALLSVTPFSWDQLNDAQKGYFKADQLNQYARMTQDQKDAAGGENLLKFIRGQRDHEGFSVGTTKYYRAREAVLGDIINSQPVYVGAPQRAYKDPGYAAFKNEQKGRTPMVYVGANDGMLHAFYAEPDASKPDAAKEAWAFVPSGIMSKLWRLADTGYSDAHTYFVDGSPVVTDIHDGTSWKTILVGGFNNGGDGFYALDVTNPLEPKGLWEFGKSEESTMGKSFGRPVVSKLKSGLWVVFLTSGYNNNGDKGHLYVLDAFTGKLIKTISTTGSGLKDVNNFVLTPVSNNTTEWVYGGDLDGNIWRFDVNGAKGATKVAVLTGPDGNPQPVTTRVELVESSYQSKKPRILVGTGKLYAQVDVSDTRIQSVYGFDDPILDTAYTDLRSKLKRLKLNGDLVSKIRTLTCDSTPNKCKEPEPGWYLDLPDGGERVNIDMKMAYTTLVFASNVPNQDPCQVGGYGWVNYLNFETGTPVSEKASVAVADSTISGQGITSNGKGKATNHISTTGVLKDPVDLTIPYVTPSPRGARVTWREVLR